MKECNVCDFLNDKYKELECRIGYLCSDVKGGMSEVTAHQNERDNLFEKVYAKLASADLKPLVDAILEEAEKATLREEFGSSAVLINTAIEIVNLTKLLESSNAAIGQLKDSVETLKQLQLDINKQRIVDKLELKESVEYNNKLMDRLFASETVRGQKESRVRLLEGNVEFYKQSWQQERLLTEEWYQVDVANTAKLYDMQNKIDKMALILSRENIKYDLNGD